MPRLRGERALGATLPARGAAPAVVAALVGALHSRIVPNNIVGQLIERALP
jgi:hypothetical protein